MYNFLSYFWASTLNNNSVFSPVGDNETLMKISPCARTYHLNIWVESQNNKWQFLKSSSFTQKDYPDKISSWLNVRTGGKKAVAELLLKKAEISTTSILCFNWLNFITNQRRFRAKENTILSALDTADTLDFFRSSWVYQAYRCSATVWHFSYRKKSRISLFVTNWPSQHLTLHAEKWKEPGYHLKLGQQLNSCLEKNI